MSNPKSIPPKATNRPTPMAMAKEPGTLVGLFIPIDLRLKWFKLFGSIVWMTVNLD